MNFFTGRHAVSLFPQSTFIDRTSYVCRDTSRDNREWMVKYRARGFEVVVAGGVASVEEPLELAEWDRWIGDRYCWVLPFTPAGSYRCSLTYVLLLTHV